MILRNWMVKNPVTVESGTLVSQAQHLITEKGLRALPVVDDGRLRGLLTRRDLLTAVHCVARTQDVHELAYFNQRLKVKDLMIRFPKTVGVDDSVESCMFQGQRDQVSFYPVMEGDRLVGTVSAVEIFRSLSKILGGEEHWSGISLEAREIDSGTLRQVAQVVEEAGVVLQGLFTMAVNHSGKRRIILRFVDGDPAALAARLGEAGFPALEVVDMVQDTARSD